MEPMPQPINATHKFDKDWQTNLGILEFESVGVQMDNTGSSLYYKLILWGIGSGELNKLSIL